MSIFLFAAAALSAPVLCVNPIVTDGDTFKCAGGVKNRMSGIDTPEMPGHCRKGRICVDGDPIASRDSLNKALKRGPVTYVVLKKDLYGRNIILAYSGGENLSCYQLKNGQAIYKPTWDAGKHIAQECGVK